MEREAMDWEALLNSTRFVTEVGNKPPQASDKKKISVSDFQEDYGRIIRSSAFRRLKNKTQVFTFPKNDFVRDRLTHSYEVAYYGRLLGNMAGLFIEMQEGIENLGATVSEIVSSACLAHDLGNPPFGHVGEDAVRYWYETAEHSYLRLASNDIRRFDFQNFDGNAQSFRIVTKLQGWRERGGLQLTYATLAAMCKYPFTSNHKIAMEKKKFGFFQDDMDSAERIFGSCGLSKDKTGKFQRHPLSYLVEAADDIAYLTTDIQDGFRAGRIPFEVAEGILKSTSDARGYLLRYNEVKNQEMDKINYLASAAAPALLEEAITRFQIGYKNIMDGTYRGGLLDNCGLSDEIDEIRNVAKTHLHYGGEKGLADAEAIHILPALLSKFAGPLERLLMLQGSRNDLSKADRILVELLPADNIDRSTFGSDAYETLKVLVDVVTGMTDGHSQEMYKRLYAFGGRRD